MKVESGTCNVCSAPCSSCMHYNRAVSFVALKTEDEFSGETCQGKAASRCSFNDVVLPPKSRAFNDKQPTTSEISNLPSTSSSNDSFSENAESKVLRTFETSEDVKMLPQQYSGGVNSQDLPIPKTTPCRRAVISAGDLSASNLVQRNFSSQDHEQKVFDCHGDNISCVSGASDADIASANYNADMERKNVSCSSVSVCSFSPELIENQVNDHNASGCLSDSPCRIEESCTNSRSPGVLSKESVQKKSLAITPQAYTYKTDPSEAPSSKDLYASNNSPKVQTPYSPPHSDKVIFYNADAKDLEENSFSPSRGEPFKSSIEHVEPSLNRVAILGVGGENFTGCNSTDIPLKLEPCEPNLVRSASFVSVKVYPCDAEVAIDNGEPETEAVKCSEKNDQVEKIGTSSEVAYTDDPPVQSQPIDETDGSEILEDDVKVCDICGDAGREEMLAFCSRCSDGAEHTYCMRIMLDKVPDGDWLCEECKLKEETETQDQDKLETVSGNSKEPCLNGKDKSRGAGKVTSEHLPNSDVKEAKLDVKNLDTEGTKVGSSQPLPAKRRLDGVEVASAAKRQVHETTIGSPTTSSPGRKAALSQESSFKNLDKGKVKSSQPIPSSGNQTANSSQVSADYPTVSARNLLRTQSRLQSPRGILLKSNSFSTSSSKPRVKLMQDDASPKKKLANEVSVNDSKKQAVVKTISKSTSFKTTLTGRPNSTESKVKMLPSNFNRTEDLKGTKQAKERNLVERKSSLKLDRPTVCSSAALSSVSNVKDAKDDQKTTFHAETNPSFSSANCRDLKAVQPAGKSEASMKRTSLLGKRKQESPTAMAGLDDGKRLTSLASSALGAPSNGKGTSIELKARQAVSKEEPIRMNGNKSGSKHDVIMQDGLSQPGESIIREGRTREPPISRSRPVGAQKIRCNNCKQLSHVTHCCPIGSPWDSVVEVSLTGRSQDVMGRSTKLKEAVEAAVLKKPGLFKKNKLGDQSDELSMLSTDLSCDVVPKDQLSTPSSCLRNLNSGEGTSDARDIVGSAAAASPKTASVDVKQHVAPPMEHISKAELIDADTKMRPCMRESHILDSAGAAQSQFSVIPEHDYIWLGGFKVQGSGMLPELYDGIQAHLSSRASPKVLEVVNKFPSNVQMEEVPRQSAWPVQFLEHPATEDNIALYFFAKDIESYEGSYRSLLNNMIKNDLALKGNFDSIELLVFPSSQLPDKSQRWNTLFFFWGVFRGKRVNNLEQVPAYEEKLSQTSADNVPLDQDSSDHVVQVSEINCSSGKMDEGLSSFNGAHQPAKSSISSELQLSRGLDLNCEAKVDSPDQEFVDFKSNFDQDNSNHNTSLPCRDQTDVKCPEPNNSGLLLVEQIDRESKLEVGLRSTVQVNRQNCSSIKGKQVSTGIAQWDSSVEEQDTLSLLKRHTVDTFHGLGVGVNTDDENIQERINDHSRDQMRIPIETKDERLVRLGTACVETTVAAPVEKECSSWDFNRKCLHPDLAQMVSSAAGSSAILWKEKMDCVLLDGKNGSKQVIPFKKEMRSVLVDGVSESKKMKQCFSEEYVSSSSKGQSSLSANFASHIQRLPGFPVREQEYDAAYDDLRATERHFFPMDFDPVSNHRFGSTSLPWIVPSSGDGNEHESEVLNLELALGPKQGRLSLFGQRISETNTNKRLESATRKDNDDNCDRIGSLALSLASPFSEKDLTARHVVRAEQTSPGRHQVNTSLLLFRHDSDA